MWWPTLKSMGTEAGSETALLFYSWLRPLLLIFFRRFAYHSQYPQGFMVLPLHGVSSAASCSGTLDRGFIFHFRDPLNYSVVVVIWTFVALVTYMCPVIGVRCCKAWATHLILKFFFYFFQILILSCEPFISLSFFSHCRGDRPTLKVPPKFDGPIIFCV